MNGKAWNDGLWNLLVVILILCMYIYTYHIYYYIYILNLRIIYIYVCIYILINHPGVSIEYAIDSDAQKKRKNRMLNTCVLFHGWSTYPP